MSSTVAVVFRFAGNENVQLRTVALRKRTPDEAGGWQRR